MRNKGLSRRLRAPRNRVAAALCILIAFVATLWLSCSCGPECCDMVPSVQSAHMTSTDHGCCGAPAPEAPPAPKDCCSGVECCRADIATHKLVQNTANPVADFTGILLEIPGLKVPPAITQPIRHARSTSATAQGPPPYLRFEILLI